MGFLDRFLKRAHKDPTSLGNMLVEHGLCVKEDIASALADDLTLGEALIRAGKLTEQQLELMLARQNLARGRRNGAGKSIDDIAIERAKQSTGRWNHAQTLAAAHNEKLK